MDLLINRKSNFGNKKLWAFNKLVVIKEITISFALNF